MSDAHVDSPDVDSDVAGEVTNGPSAKVTGEGWSSVVRCG